MATKQTITFDPTNLEAMKKLMEEYGHLETMQFGKNELGEDIAISIFTDKIVVNTYQSNHWIRRNVYYRDGEQEELYEGRWS